MGAEAFLSARKVSARGKVGRRCLRTTVVPGSGGDHPAIGHFLAAVFPGFSRREFKASLEDPFYEPHDRLLIWRDGEIVGHAQVTHRVMQFGQVQLPVAGLARVATAPEWAGQGLGRMLLEAAEKHMVRTGALVGLLQTRVPRFFHRSGWVACGRHSYSRADVRAVLSQLLDAATPRPAHRALQIRPWRRWEAEALRRIYEASVENTYGPRQRSDAYWQWLIRRQAYDQIYVALASRRPLEPAETNAKIVGYAVTRGERIVEMFSAAGRPGASAELLHRVCGDSIEHDRQDVVLCAPCSSPMHALFREAGGRSSYEPSDRGEVLMARVLAPLTLLRQLCGEFHRRAEQAGLPLPIDLGLLVEGQKCCLEIRPQDARAVSHHIGRSYLKASEADFTHLLLGQLDWTTALADGRIQASTALAQEAGRVLLPQLQLWHPPWDDLAAS